MARAHDTEHNEVLLQPAHQNRIGRDLQNAGLKYIASQPEVSFEMSKIKGQSLESSLCNLLFE